MFRQGVLKKVYLGTAATMLSTGLVAVAQVSLAGSAGAATTTFSLANCSSAQQYVVPADVSVVRIVAGGSGGSTAYDPPGVTKSHYGGVGGQPGFVTATVPVTPGQTLYVGSTSGGKGGPPLGPESGAGGDGGASAYVTTDSSATCGRHSVSSALVVAAGGGGGGGGEGFGPGGTGGAGGLPYGAFGNGGGGGGRDGDSHIAAAGGFGADQNGPGDGGAPGNRGCGNREPYATAGASGDGMIGGDGGLYCFPDSIDGGGGGAGYFGGGGGGGGAGGGGGGGGGGYSYAAPNAKFISYPSSGTQQSVAITPVGMSMSAHVEAGSPRATVTSAPYGTVVHLVTTLSATATGVPLNGQTRYRCPSGCTNTELGLGFSSINDDGTYGDDKGINTSALGPGNHHLTVSWSDSSGLFPNQVIGFDLNVVPPPPVVTQDPGDTSVTYGGSATFTSAATVAAGTSPTVQWETSGDNGGSWSNVGDGGTSATLTVTPKDKAFNDSTRAVPDFDGRLYRATWTSNDKSVTSASAKLTVHKAALTIAAVNKTYTVGTTPPDLTATYDGFVTLDGVKETPAKLTGTLSCTSAGAAANAAIGNYPIACSGLTSPSNYDVTYTDGTLKIIGPPPACADQSVGTTVASAATRQRIPLTLHCTDAAGPVAYQIVGSPTSGITIQTNYTDATGTYDTTDSGRMTYAPDADFEGTATFTYRAIGSYGTSRTATVTVTVVKAAQTITFAAPSGVTYGDADSSLGAAASSGLVVTYVSTTPSVCTIVASKLHIVSGGQCTVRADQPGNSNFQAAGQVERTFTIAKAMQTITFAQPGNTVFEGADVALPATATSGLFVTLSSLTPATCTIVNGKAHPTGAGTCTITASQPGDGNYSPATSISRSLTVAKAPIVVTTSSTPSLVSLLTLQVGYTSTVRSATTGLPIAGITVTTRIDGGPANTGCTAVTNAAGVAKCTSGPILIPILTTFKATAAESANYLGGTASGKTPLL